MNIEQLRALISSQGGSINGSMLQRIQVAKERADFNAAVDQRKKEKLARKALRKAK